MDRKGFLNIIIAVVIAAVLGGGIYMLRYDRQEVLTKSTGLSQELLDIALVKEYISDASGSIDKNLLPFKSDSYPLELRLVTMPGDWNKYKSSYFPNGIPNFDIDSSSKDYSKNKEYILQFPTNEHGGANLWDLEGQFVYQLCSHCGIVGSYWMDDSKFILLNVISSGQSDDGKYHKVIQLYDLTNKTVSVSISAGISESPAQPVNNEPPAPPQTNTEPVATSNITVKIALTGAYDEIGSGENFGCGDTVVLVPRQVPKTPQVLNAAFRELLSAPNSISYNGHDLHNVVYSMRNNLKFESATILSGVAKVYFTGEFGGLGGVCDSPRVRPVIEATAKQFPTVKSVEIYLNNKLFDWTDFGSQR